MAEPFEGAAETRASQYYGISQMDAAEPPFPRALDYFRGGVPAGAVFHLQTQRLQRLIDRRRSRSAADAQAEVCFIGLIAYFEAFCGDHFASILNLCPSLIEHLKQRGRDVSVDATDLQALGENILT
jgi:hypothetical protein